MNIPWLERPATHALSDPSGPQQQVPPTGSEEDIEHAMQAFSTLSFESLASSFSDISPLAEEAILFHSGKRLDSTTGGCSYTRSIAN